MLDNGFKIVIDNNEGRNKPKLSQINVYTDGSKTKDGVGAGIIIMKGRSKVIYTESISIDKQGSIFQAEAIGLENAANKLRIWYPGKKGKVC